MKDRHIILDKASFIATIINKVVIIAFLKTGSSYIRRVAKLNKSNVYECDVLDFKVKCTNYQDPSTEEIIEKALFDVNYEYNSIILYRDPFVRFCSALNEDFFKTIRVYPDLMFRIEENRILLNPLYQIIEANLYNKTLNEVEVNKNLTPFQLQKKYINVVLDYLLEYFTSHPGHVFTNHNSSYLHFIYEVFLLKNSVFLVDIDNENLNEVLKKNGVQVKDNLNDADTYSDKDNRQKIMKYIEEHDFKTFWKNHVGVHATYFYNRINLIKSKKGQKQPIEIFNFKPKQKDE